MLGVTAAAVIFIRLLDKLDGSWAGTLSIRMDRSVHVTQSLWLWIWSPLSETYAFLSLFISSLLLFFDPTNNCGKKNIFIYTQLHSSRFPQMLLLLLLIKSCVVPNDYMTFKVTVIVFFWRSFNSIWSLVFTTKTQHVMTTEVCVTSSFYEILLFVVLSVAHWTYHWGCLHLSYIS